MHKAQAFCQVVLSKDERYVLHAPPGCPLTPPNTLWLLKRTLYGLKRSLCHCSKKMTEMLEKIGLLRCPNSPCLFQGHIIPGDKPLYLGLYVDDFVYFSESTQVEKQFETALGALTNSRLHGTSFTFSWNTIPVETAKRKQYSSTHVTRVVLRPTNKTSQIG